MNAHAQDYYTHIYIYIYVHSHIVLLYLLHHLTIIIPPLENYCIKLLCNVKRRRELVEPIDCRK